MLRVFIAGSENYTRQLTDSLPWTKYGFELLGCANDGERALAMIRNCAPDVLITDYHMPYMDGLTLSHLVLREFPDSRIILSSDEDSFLTVRQQAGDSAQYSLMNPLGLNSLLPVLMDLQDKRRREQQEHSPRLQRQDFAQFERRVFFEKMASGQLSLEQIYENARELELDLKAECYCVAFFTMPPEEQRGAAFKEGILKFFLKYPEYVLIRWSLSAYMLLIMGDRDKMPHHIQRAKDTVKEQFERHLPQQQWHMAIAQAVDRPSLLPGCFAEAARLWAYRLIFPQQTIMNAESADYLLGCGSEDVLNELDVRKIDPSIFSGVLSNGSIHKIADFADVYLRSVEAALESRAFCQYLMLSVRFGAVSFLRSLGIEAAELTEKLSCLDMTGSNVTLPELKSYITDILMRSIELRDRQAVTVYRGVLRRAVDYIEANYSQSGLTLKKLAQELKVSPNYLSALFTKQLGQGFSSYLTAKRMEKARELLRSSRLGSAQIARQLGYEDSRYFSTLFKKTQGCTPSEYREKHRQ